MQSKLLKFKFSEIHAAIIMHNNTKEAANALGVDLRSLPKYLSQLSYQNEPLTFKRLHNIPAEEMAATLGAQYQAPWVPKQVHLDQLPFATIHASILNHAKVTPAASALGVTIESLKKYLSKLSYQNEPLTFERLRDLSAEEMVAAIGEQYQAPWVPNKVHLNQLSFAVIHACILNHAQVTPAAKALGVSIESLKRYLSKLSYQNEPLTFKRLRDISAEEMAAALGEQYQGPWTPNQVHLNQLPFATIHASILNHTQASNAASALGVTPQTLQTYLSKLSYQNEPLSFARLRNISAEDMTVTLGEQYQGPWIPNTVVHPNQLPFATIHASILNHAQVSNAASALGVTPQTLQTYLSQLSYQNEPLTFERLRNITAEEMAAALGEQYQAFWIPNTVHLNQLPFAVIHANILNYTKITPAASALGVDILTLKRYLSKLSYQNEPLTFKRLHDMPAEEMAAALGEQYYAPWIPNQVHLNQLPFATIHASILNHAQVTPAASALGVTRQTLQTYLSKLSYQNEPLSFERLHNIPAEDMTVALGEQYYAPWVPNTVHLSQLPFATIHASILKHSKSTPAANALGVGIEFLKSYLSKLNYQNEPLTIERLRDITAEEMAVVLGEQYYTPWVPNKSHLNQLPFATIHASILNHAQVSNAASALGVTLQTLKRYLSQLNYQNEPLSFERLHDMPAEEMAAALGEQYYAPWVPNKSPLSQLPFATIHVSILNHAQISNAASALGVTPKTLKKYLSQLSYQNEPLTFERLRNIPAEGMAVALGEQYNNTPWEIDNIVVNDVLSAAIEQTLHDGLELDLEQILLDITHGTQQEDLSHILESVADELLTLPDEALKSMSSHAANQTTSPSEPIAANGGELTADDLLTFLEETLQSESSRATNQIISSQEEDSAQEDDVQIGMLRNELNNTLTTLEKNINNKRQLEVGENDELPSKRVSRWDEPSSSGNSFLESSHFPGTYTAMPYAFNTYPERYQQVHSPYPNYNNVPMSADLVFFPITFSVPSDYPNGAYAGISYNLPHVFQSGPKPNGQLNDSTHFRPFSIDDPLMPVGHFTPWPGTSTSANNSLCSFSNLFAERERTMPNTSNLHHPTPIYSDPLSSPKQLFFAQNNKLNQQQINEYDASNDKYNLINNPKGG
ncbi:putative DNAse [Legionella busanensis]|uniref:Putative DNAse n=1 Tax=Legionella busanensis TaxID=190655 RepID=A0A378JNM9_9GAMM|nr:hypothetical protein [Legionella busanensis]STX52864.1 putative DNAse [Legionella busanensis]